MQSSELKIDIEYEQKLKKGVLLTIDSIPYATAIYILNNDCIHFNKLALNTLEINKTEDFDIVNWRKRNPYIEQVIRRLTNNNILLDQKVLIVLNSGKKEIMNFNLSVLRNTTIGHIYVIYFNKVSTKYSASVMSSLHSIKEEVRKLAPFLNKAGKELLTEITEKYFTDHDKSLGINHLMYYEKEIFIIQESFPFLKHHEIIICSLLINNMDDSDISFLTKKSLNSIYVTVHRIKKKMNVKNRTELRRLLLAAVEK